MKSQGLLIALALGSVYSVAQAGAAFVNYDDFHYSGSVKRFATLADATNNTNAIGTFNITTATNDTRSTLSDARDASIYAGNGVPAAYGIDYGYFGFAWYFTTLIANGNGWGNPNNTCAGLIQYNDETGSATSTTGSWSDGNTRFNLQMSGTGGDGGDAARAWAGGSGCGDAGYFASFNLLMTADFGVAATLDGGTGWYTNSSTPVDVSGSVSGIFVNDSASVPANNGYFTFSLTLDEGSWAAAEGAVWTDGTSDYGVTRFFASDTSTNIPTPGTLLLVAASLAGLGRARRRLAVKA